MAYREFRNEKTYAAPDIAGLPLTLQAIQNQNQLKFQNKKLKNEQDKARQDEMKNLAFDNPEDFDKEYITKSYISPFLVDAQGHVRQGGSVQDEPLTKRRRSIDGVVAKSKSDAAMLTQGKELVAQMPDWVNKDAQTALMKEAYAGQGRNVDNRDMSTLMRDIDPSQNAQLFNQQKFVAKALEDFKAQTRGTNSTVEKGAITTGTGTTFTSVAGIRFNDKTKGYEIDPAKRAEVINGFFQTGGDMGGKTWANILQKEAEAEVEAEADRFMSAEKAKGRTFTSEEAQKLKDDFKINPTLNPYSGGKRIADRVLDKAEKKILNQAQINHQYDYTRTMDEPRQPSESEKKKTPDLVITPGLYTGQSKSSTNNNMPYGAAGVTVMHKQKPLKITSTIPTTFSVKNGRKDNQNTERTFTTNKVQLMPVTKSGNLVFVKAQTEAELVKNIQGMSDEMVLKMNPDLQLFFRGTFGDRMDTRNDGEGADPQQMAEAGATAVLNKMLNKGVKQELSDEFVPANDDMLGQVASYGITRENIYSAEMQQVQQAFAERYQKALDRQQGKTKTTSTKTASSATAKDDYWNNF